MEIIKILTSLLALPQAIPRAIPFVVTPLISAPDQDVATVTITQVLSNRHARHRIVGRVLSRWRRQSFESIKRGECNKESLEMERTWLQKIRDGKWLSDEVLAKFAEV